MIDVVVMMVMQVMLESLPISSSGHSALVALYAKKIGMHVSPLPRALDHLLHLPTMIIVAICFRASWFSIIKNVYCVYDAWSRNKIRTMHTKMMRLFVAVLCMVVVTDSITGVCYIVGHAIDISALESHLSVVILLGFIVTALLLLSTYYMPSQHQRRHHHWLLISCAVGLVQAMALLPGISRFAVTVVIAQWMGMSARRAVQFSFACFFPLMFAAVVVHGLPLVGHVPTLLTSICLWQAGLAGLVILSSYFLFLLACQSFERQRVWPFVTYMVVPISCLIYMMMLGQ